MSKINDGGPAYPTRIPMDMAPMSLDEAAAFLERNAGMSLRDKFAGQATVDSEADFPQGLGQYKATLFAMGLEYVSSADDFWQAMRNAAAVESAIRYAKADAMLAERKKPCYTQS